MTIRKIYFFCLKAELNNLNKFEYFAILSYGYSNMTYITSLISGVGIFCFGTGLSWYHGIMGLYDPHPIESLRWVLFNTVYIFCECFNRNTILILTGIAFASWFGL